jgi:hypothetical protein
MPQGTFWAWERQEATEPAPGESIVLGLDQCALTSNSAGRAMALTAGS